MKTIIDTARGDLIELGRITKEVSEYCPIFVTREGEAELAGMAINEGTVDEPSWIVRIGGPYGAYGDWPSLEKLIQEGHRRGYSFHMNVIPA